jgi:hypothetical protein
MDLQVAKGARHHRQAVVHSIDCGRGAFNYSLGDYRGGVSTYRGTLDSAGGPERMMEGSFEVGEGSQRKVARLVATLANEQARGCRWCCWWRRTVSFLTEPEGCACVPLRVSVRRKRSYNG